MASDLSQQASCAQLSRKETECLNDVQQHFSAPNIHPYSAHVLHMDGDLTLPDSGIDVTADSDDARENHHKETVEGPDFSHLPELFLIHVFQLLSLSDRYHLSQVNWFFNTLFHDGSVWRRATITFTKALVHGYFYITRFKLRLSERDKKLARKFGHFYREVILRMRGRPEELEDDTQQVLTHLQKSWRLEALTLDLGDREWGNRNQSVDPIKVSLLIEVMNILKDSTALRVLRVQHWPHSSVLKDGGEFFELRQLLSTAECLKLQFLRLPRTSENGTRTLNIPAYLALEVVNKFRCLRHLYVISDMLSEALFDAVVTSRDVPMKMLSVEIHGLWTTGLLDHLLSPLPWSKLTARYPDFAMNLTVSSEVPEFALASFLVPEIPLVAVTFDINSHCFRKAFLLMQQYSETLRSFRCFTDPKDCELELVDMVEICSKVQHLHFHGVISDFNVLRLAEAGGRRWGQFVFLWRNIEKTWQRPTPFNLVAATTAHTDNNATTRTEEEVKVEFCQQVSKSLGFKWEPLVL